MVLYLRNHLNHRSCCHQLNHPTTGALLDKELVFYNGNRRCVDCCSFGEIGIGFGFSPGRVQAGGGGA